MSSKEQKIEATFEEAMEKLGEIVKQLESGDVPLEKAIELFQEGMSLSKLCHDKLQKVEQQVNFLVDEEGQTVQKPFHLEGDLS